MFSALKSFGGPLLWQYMAVIIANLACLCTGMSVSWSSPVLVKLKNETETVLGRVITDDEGSWLVSIGLITSIVSNFLVMYLVDSIGRKHCITLTQGIRILSCCLLTFGTEVWVLLLGKSFAGIADTFAFTVVPIYASEIASKEIRGSLGTFLQLLSSVGVFIMLSVGPFLKYITLNSIVLAVAIVCCLPIPLVPESPYYLHVKGRNEEALEVLTTLRGSEDKAKEEIKQYSSSKTDEKPNKLKLFKDRIFLKSLCFAMVLGGGLQLTGFNSISSYLQTILESTHTSFKSEIASVVLGCIQILAAICTSFLIDKFGRKPILGVTLSGMTLGMIGLGVFFKLYESGNTVEGALNYLPLISFIIYVFSFSAGIGALSWLIIPEIFEGPGRSVGTSSSLIISLMCFFLTARFFVHINNALGPAATYWMFGGISLALNIFIMCLLPETKGKTIKEIQISLGRQVENIEREKC